MFECLECGKKFKTVAAAEKASMDGCPKCGGVDIDFSTSYVPATPEPNAKASARKFKGGMRMKSFGSPVPVPAFNEAECGGAFDGFNVTSDADPGM